MDGEMPARDGNVCAGSGVPDQKRNATPDWPVGLLLSVLVIAVYGQTLDFEFLSWDDFRHVCNNPAVREGLTLESVGAAFTSRLTFHWHPLTMLSHMLDVELFGLHAGGHHATNVVLHLLNTLLLFSLLHSMSGSRWPSALVAAIFAVHPLHVENVAWISERKDLLCAFFGLLSIHAYLRYVRQRRGAWFALACVMLLFGLLSKSMLITLPLVLLLLDYWPLSRFNLPRPGIAGGDRSSRRHLSPTTIIGSVVEKLPLFAISIVFAGVSILVHRVAAQKSHLSAVPLPQRLLNAAVSYAWYVAKTFWPTKLAANYVHPYLPGGMPWNSAHICVALLLLTVVSAVIFAAVRRPYLIAGWLWFLVMLLPVAGFIQIGVQGRASRYMYLPIIGLLLIAIWGVKEGAERLFQSRWRLCRHLMFSLGVAWVLSCAAASFRQTGHWHDSMRFYTRELKIVPNDPYFHTNIAYHLVKKGEYDTAITHCSRALAILPDLPQAHLMLANIYGDLGERERASYHEEQARRDR